MINRTSSPISRSMSLCIVLFLLGITAFSNAFAQTKIVMLGTGSPVPFPDRSGPATAIVVDNKSYLFDFGPGVGRQAAAMAPRFGGSIEALDPVNLNIAFLTHLHSDHTIGFPDFLLTGWTSGKRKERVQVFGPEGIAALVKGTHDAYDDDIKYRLYARGAVSFEGWRVDTTVVKEGLVYEDESIRVIAFPVLHGNWPNAFGYRVETKDKVVVLSGDLRPSPKLKEYSQDADYLIHEVYCQAGLDKMSPKHQRYHASNHTSTTELAEIATDLKPKVLVLNHVIWFGCNEEQIVSEMKAGYSGKLILANDLDVYE